MLRLEKYCDIVNKIVISLLYCYIIVKHIVLFQTKNMIKCKNIYGQLFYMDYVLMAMQPFILPYKHPKAIKDYYLLLQAL